MCSNFARVAAPSPAARILLLGRRKMRIGFLVPAAVVLASVCAPYSSARADDAPKAAVAPAAPADAAGDATKAQSATPAKASAIAVAQMLRDAAALRALVLKKSLQIAAAD